MRSAAAGPSLPNGRRKEDTTEEQDTAGKKILPATAPRRQGRRRDKDAAPTPPALTKGLLFRPELFTLPFVKAVVCEFVATTIFIFIALGAAFNWPSGEPSVLHISLAFGLAVATLIQACGHISGTHINPAVTMAFFVGNQISIFRLLFYMALQLMGSVVGAWLIYSLTPSKVHGTLAVNDLSDNVSPGEALVVEMILTFTVVMCIFSSTDQRRTDNRDNPALAIGMAVTMAHLVGIYYTGCSINPARSFGPAVVMREFSNAHWVFWLGPFTGGTLASVIYNYVLYPHKLTMDERMAIVKGVFRPEPEPDQGASTEATESQTRLDVTWKIIPQPTRHKEHPYVTGALNAEFNEITPNRRKETTHPVKPLPN
ncbi:aquaporin-5-like [Paroedura picta]|uniref:aquaporin-5-like n=1 Tax=Paroedura picta TaxID=143630 RepID=UPI004056F6A2